jgi:hypothetical protein
LCREVCVTIEFSRSIELFRQQVNYHRFSRRGRLAASQRRAGGNSSTGDSPDSRHHSLGKNMALHFSQRLLHTTRLLSSNKSHGRRGGEPSRCGAHLWRLDACMACCTFWASRHIATAVVCECQLKRAVRLRKTRILHLPSLGNDGHSKAKTASSRCFRLMPNVLIRWTHPHPHPPH